MLGETHSVVHEFPEYKERVEKLKHNNPDFSSLMSQHDQLDKKIRGLETTDQPVNDSYMEDLKKQRLALKDKLYDLLRTNTG